MNMKKEIRICSSKSDLAQMVAEQIIEICNKTISRADICTVALAGGSTPREVYSMLASAPHRERIDWNAVRLFWGDERAVSPDHRESNFGMTRETLLQGIEIPAKNVHRIQGEVDPEIAALEYAEILQAEFGTKFPEFDLVLLGIGEDGHTASLFPGTPAVAEQERSVTEVFVQKMNTWRITLTLPVLNRARHVIFTVVGQAKGEIVKMIMNLDKPSHELPASLVQPDQGRLYWFFDSAAGASVTSASQH
jgi:6-phosphogluconolactonase